MSKGHEYTSQKKYSCPIYNMKCLISLGIKNRLKEQVFASKINEYF